MEVRDEFKISLGMALEDIFGFNKAEEIRDIYIDKINRNNNYGSNLSFISNTLSENIPIKDKEKYAFEIKSSEEITELGLDKNLSKAINNACILPLIPPEDMEMINIIKDYLNNSENKKEATKTIMLYLSFNYMYANKLDIIDDQRIFFDAVKQFSDDMKLKKIDCDFYAAFAENIINWSDSHKDLVDNNTNYYAMYLNLMKYTYIQHKEEKKFIKAYEEQLLPQDSSTRKMYLDKYSHYQQLSTSTPMKNSFKKLMYKDDERVLPVTDGEYSIGFLSSFPEYQHIPLALGEIVNNCQRMGDAGETAMLHGVLNPNAGFVIIVNNRTGEIKAESEVFIQKKKDKNIFCFDSIEITHGLNPVPYERLICQFVEERLKNYDNVYVGRGYRDPETNEFDKLPEHFLNAGAKDKKGIRPEITPFEAYLYSHEEDNENDYGIIDSVEEAERLLNEGTISSFDFLYTDIADNDNKESDTKFAYQIKKNGDMLIDKDKLPSLESSMEEENNFDEDEPFFNFNDEEE